jgi:hypothetical protein
MNNTMCIYQLFNDINEIANIKADIVWFYWPFNYEYIIALI